ncbi:MAG: redoxin domain-containing protein [Pirellulaceae bacterium]|nr:redoxin domain-containing protein [Pirellulaceae bacterium]
MMDRFLPVFTFPRSSNCALATAVLVSWALPLAPPAVAETPSPAAALSLRPVQKTVEYERVAKDAMADCEVRDLNHKTWTGWEVIADDGTLLRRFADTNKDKKVDLWCYYNFGIEVYRDVDADFNGKADQYQWLGTGGTRWGLDDDEDGTIDRWKRISVEEVSAEVVAALGSADAQRFSRLLATDRELAAVGLGRDKVARLATKSDRAARGFTALAKRQTSVGPDAKWVQFASSPPGIVPEGTEGSTRDVLVYENAVAMFEEAGKSGQLLVGTVIKVGDAWRLVDLPAVGDDSDSLTQAAGNFFTPGNAALASSTGPDGIADETQQLVVELEKIDNALTEATKAAEVAQLHDQRADVVEALIEASASRIERDTWVRQLVDTVTVAVQSGTYPQGLSRLKKVGSKFARNDDDLRAYADFQTIGTEYVTRQTKDADFPKVQEWYLTALNDFIDRYPKTPEAAQAMLQLALSKEFEDKEDDALRYYRKVASAFAGTDAGEKAAGAVRRLESVGRRIEFTGTTIDGKSFSLDDLRGKAVVIHYWATWCEPCKQDIKLLRRLQARYQGLELVGVNVDATRDLATNYLEANALPWTQLFEDGGLESSPLSQQFGVQTLPTMMLIDGAGKVISHNIRAAELDGELEQLSK